MRVRLRQAVLLVEDLDAVAQRLRDALGLGEPFRDPGVAEFGLQNVVFAIGDCFLELISPMRPGTAAGRQLERAGDDNGYMVLFDLQDLEGARSRAAQAGVRTVWQIDLPDISGTHMHPRDMGGAIVSLDRSKPYGSWRWGGPDWAGRAVPGGLLSIVVAVADPEAVAARWARVLGVAVGPERALTLDGGAEVRFQAAVPKRCEGIVEVELALPGAAERDSLQVGSARIALRA